MTRTPTGIRLSSPRDVLDSIPHALGFSPRDSLVIVLLRESEGGRRRTVLTVRIDLVGPLLPDASLVDWVAVASGASSTGATSSLMAMFVDTEPLALRATWQTAVANGIERGVDAGEAVALRARASAACARQEQGELLEQASEVLTVVGAPPTDLLIVTGGRYFSLMCADAMCCPSDGTPYDPRTPGAAGLELRVAAGSSPLVDRDALARRYASDKREVEAVGEELDRPGCRTYPSPAARGVGGTSSSRPRQVARVIRAAHASFDVAEAVWVLTALVDVHVRDGVLASVLAPPQVHAEDAERPEAKGPEAERPEVQVASDERALRQYVARLTRCAPETLVAAPATMAAILEWVDGDGAAANIALERALADQPDHRLAMLMAEVVRAAVPPAQVRELLARVR